MKKLNILCGVIGFTLIATSVSADTLFGEFKRLPDAIERGFSVGFDFGAMSILENDTGAKRSASNPGFIMTVTTGYDIMEYLSIEGVYQLAINQADQDDPVLEGSVLDFVFSVAAKGTYPLGRFYPFVEIGPGIMFSKPEWPDGNKKLSILVAGGIEYYTYLRHFSLIAKGSYNYIDLPIDLMAITVGMKYTF